MPYGQVSAQNVNSELGSSNTTQLSFANTSVINLVGVSEVYNVVTTAVFTSGSGSNTAPSTATGAIVHVWGAGGGGNELRGGGGSGYSQKFIKAVGGSTVVSYNVGAGGAGSNGGTGGTGGSSNAQISGNSTTWGSTGGQGAPRAVNATGGSGSGGDINEDSAGGATTISGGQAGNAVSILNGGGSFQFGLTSAGNPYGGGGGGGSGSSAGGAGADGAIKIVWITQANTRMGRMRWGMDIPGGRFRSTANFNGIADDSTLVKHYSANADLTIIQYNSQIVGDPTSAASRAGFILHSNGQLDIFYGTSGGGIPSNNVYRTWLNSGGGAGAYTANLVVSSGTVDTGLSDAMNTNLTLDTTRSWQVFTNQIPEGSTSEDFYGNLIITETSGGAELIRRPIILDAYSERMP